MSNTDPFAQLYIIGNRFLDSVSGLIHEYSKYTERKNNMIKVPNDLTTMSNEQLVDALIENSKLLIGLRVSMGFQEGLGDPVENETIDKLFFCTTEAKALKAEILRRLKDG